VQAIVSSQLAGCVSSTSDLCENRVASALPHLLPLLSSRLHASTGCGRKGADLQLRLHPAAAATEVRESPANQERDGKGRDILALKETSKDTGGLPCQLCVRGSEMEKLAQRVRPNSGESGVSHNSKVTRIPG
jgi:predicted small lipoprotein YifL